MKQTRWIVFFVALGLSLGSFLGQAAAQQQPAAGPPSFVAVVDVAQLIKAHPDFTKKQDALKNKMLAEEAKFKTRQQAMADKEKAMQAGPLKPGTAEHQNAIDEIAGLYADFEKDARSMQRRFALENSQIMYDTYQDIKKTIAKFAKARRIAQVTDYRFFEANPAEPQSVAEDMDQKLVWFDETLDITTFVIFQMYDDRGMQRPSAEDLAKLTGQGSGAAPQPSAASAQSAPLR